MASVALLVATALSWNGWHDRRAWTLSFIASIGLDERSPNLTASIEREPDARRGELQVAQVLLWEGVDPQWLLDLPVEERRAESRQVMPRLELAREIASDAAGARPTFFLPPLIVGATTYLPLLNRAAPELFTERERWERSLLHAVELAPAYPPPRQLLCSVYLPIWGSFGEAERSRLFDLFARCFEDPATFRRLFPLWLAFAGDGPEALAVIPEQHGAWRTVAQSFAREKRWDRYVDAYARATSLLVDELEREVAAAEERLAGGDPQTAAAAMHAIAARTDPELGHAPILERILERCPAGTPSRSQAVRLAERLDWALELCVRGRCPLGPDALGRLATWSAADEPLREALAQLATGELARAATVAERVEAPLATEEWAPYVLLRARRLAEAGRLTDAAEALEPLAPAVARGDLAKDVARGIAQGPSTAGGVAWPGHAWRWSRDVARLDLLPSRPADGLVIEVVEAPPAGVAVAVRWDGALLSAVAVAPGDSVALELDVRPELHLLEVEPLAGGRFVPGAVRLTGSGGLEGSSDGDRGTTASADPP